MSLILISSIVFTINIPFGYWRANVRRFSKQWILAIHLPVPLIIFLRYFFDIGFEPITFLYFLTAYFGGQFAGVKLFQKMKLTSIFPLSSCLVMDIFRKRKSN